MDRNTSSFGLNRSIPSRHFSLGESSGLLSVTPKITNISFNSQDAFIRNLYVQNFTGINFSSSTGTFLNTIITNATITNLTGTNISFSNMTGTNANITNLVVTNLTGTNISFSNLTGTNANITNLVVTNLTGTNISFSNLTGTNAVITNLRAINFTGTTITETTFLIDPRSDLTLKQYGYEAGYSNNSNTLLTTGRTYNKIYGKFLTSSTSEVVFTAAKNKKNMWLMGGNRLNTSQDGFVWTDITNGITGVFNNNLLINKLLWNGSFWLAGCFSGGSSKTIAVSSDGYTWTGASNSPINIAVLDICWNGSYFVAGGQGTYKLAISSDGMNWTGTSSSVFTTQCSKICWNGNKFVAAGGLTGSTAHSSDGVNWTPIVFSQACTAVAWNGHYFILASLIDGGQLLWSYDNISWTAISTSIIVTGNVSDIYWNGNIFVLSGADSDGLFYSSNGITEWTNLGNSIFAEGVFSLYWNGERFMAATTNSSTPFPVGFSYDGKFWTGITGIPAISASFQTIAYTDLGDINIKVPPSRWIAVGDSGGSSPSISYSPDGTSWTQTSIQTRINAVTWNGNKYVAMAENGSIYYSLEGINWTNTNSFFFSLGTGVIWDGKTWIAIGSSVLSNFAYSSDGISWSSTAGTSTFGTGNYPLSIAWNGSIYVAVGNGNINTIAHSLNGINWTGIGTSIFTTQGNSVTWNGNIFVAVGSGTQQIISSFDGITWALVDNVIFSSGSGNAVAWNNGNTPTKGKFVAVGTGANSLAYSYDGANWIGLGTSIFTTGYSVSWNGNRWLIGGSNNTLAYSANGINWTTLTISSIVDIYGITNTNDSDGYTKVYIPLAAPLNLAIEDKLSVIGPAYYDSRFNRGLITFSS